MSLATTHLRGSRVGAGSALPAAKMASAKKAALAARNETIKKAYPSRLRIAAVLENITMELRRKVLGGNGCYEVVGVVKQPQYKRITRRERLPGSLAPTAPSAKDEAVHRAC